MTASIRTGTWIAYIKIFVLLCTLTWFKTWERVVCISMVLKIARSNRSWRRLPIFRINTTSSLNFKSTEKTLYINSTKNILPSVFQDWCLQNYEFFELVGVLPIKFSHFSWIHSYLIAILFAFSCHNTFKLFCLGRLMLQKRLRWQLKLRFRWRTSFPVENWDYRICECIGVATDGLWSLWLFHQSSRFELK